MTTITTTHGDPAVSPPPQSPRPAQSNREQTVSYADLMKPDEDWRNLPNAADRRKIQNRLAQRAYRRSLRERNEEIKRLKKQVEKLEESQAQNGISTPPREPDANAAPSVGGSGTTTSYGEPLPSAASVMSVSDWMGDYLGVWPHTPMSDHGSLAGFSHGQAEPFASDLPGMDAAAEHMLQSAADTSLEHAGTAAETVCSALTSCRLQHQGKACSSSGSNNNHNHHSNGTSQHADSGMFSYQSMSLGSDTMAHTRGHGDPMATASPSMKPFTFGGSTQMLGAATPRLSPCNDSDKTMSFSNHAGQAMETGTCNTYSEMCRTATAPSHAAAGRCCCGGHAGHAPDVPGRGSSHASKDHERPKTVLQPLDMDSLYTQGHLLHRGVVVEPSECGDGVKIRLQPGISDGQAVQLFAFMIQRDAPPLNDNQGCMMDTATTDSLHL